MRKPMLVLAVLLAAGLVVAGCGGDDDGNSGGSAVTGTAPEAGSEPAGSADAQSVYEDCVAGAQYATEEAAREACAQIQQDYEDCVASGETNLGTPATPEECRSAALPTS